MPKKCLKFSSFYAQKNILTSNIDSIPFHILDVVLSRVWQSTPHLHSARCNQPPEIWKLNLVTHVFEHCGCFVLGKIYFYRFSTDFYAQFHLRSHLDANSFMLGGNFRFCLLQDYYITYNRMPSEGYKIFTCIFSIYSYIFRRPR